MAMGFGSSGGDGGSGSGLNLDPLSFLVLLQLLRFNGRGDLDLLNGLWASGAGGLFRLRSI